MSGWPQNIEMLVRDIVKVGYDGWKEQTFRPESLPQMLENIRKVWSNESTLHHLIFPECGCAFLEWHAVILLGNHLHTVTLMDAKMNDMLPLYGRIWQDMASRTNVKLVTLSSYDELVAQITTIEHDKTLTGVIYINGSLRFHNGMCKDPNTCRYAACAFWDWSDENAINKRPINYVGDSIMLPSNSETWKQLAHHFRQQ